MVIKIPLKFKGTPAAAVVEAPKEASAAAVLAGKDELNEVQKEIEALGALMKRVETAKAFLKDFDKSFTDLCTKIDKINEDADPMEPIVVQAEKFRVVLGKKSEVRVISNLEKAIEYMGTETFMKVASIALKDIDAYLTLPQRDEVVTKSLGSRSKKLEPVKV